ncbi:hypothetical protein EZS27_023439, partial [termite gut metagenome]
RDYYIVDSMPVEVCRLSRSRRSRICREEVATSPDKGYCATQKIGNDMKQLSGRLAGKFSYTANNQ